MCSPERWALAAGDAGGVFGDAALGAGGGGGGGAWEDVHEEDAQLEVFDDAAHAADDPPAGGDFDGEVGLVVEDLEHAGEPVGAFLVALHGFEGLEEGLRAGAGVGGGGEEGDGGGVDLVEQAEGGGAVGHFGGEVFDGFLEGFIAVFGVGGRGVDAGAVEGAGGADGLVEAGEHGGDHRRGIGSLLDEGAAAGGEEGGAVAVGEGDALGEGLERLVGLVGRGFGHGGEEVLGPEDDFVVGGVGIGSDGDDAVGGFF